MVGTATLDADGTAGLPMDTMSPPRRRLDADLTLAGGFVVALVVLSVMRVLDVGPWALQAWDLVAYWHTRDGLDYATARQGDSGAYLYSPAFAQLIAGLAALPWLLFAAIWTVIAALPLLWIAGRSALPLLLAPPVFISVVSGQLDPAFAAAAILGLRWPAAWVLPILTKVTPGICLIWYAVRREWRSLGMALAATAAVVAVSAAIDPAGWIGWFGFLARADFPELDGRLVFLPVSLWIRLPIVVALVAWGAATDRRWVLPVGVMLALPTVWVNSLTLLVGVLPLVAAGARTPAAGWLRRFAGDTRVAARRPLITGWPRLDPAELMRSLRLAHPRFRLFRVRPE